MKFFKCHSQKLKDEKIIRLQDKFTDIGPDVFSGCAAKYILLAETTTAIITKVRVIVKILFFIFLTSFCTVSCRLCIFVNKWCYNIHNED